VTVRHNIRDGAGTGLIGFRSGRWTRPVGPVRKRPWNGAAEGGEKRSMNSNVRTRLPEGGKARSGLDAGRGDARRCGCVSTFPPGKPRSGDPRASAPPCLRVGALVPLRALVLVLVLALVSGLVGAPGFSARAAEVEPLGTAGMTNLMALSFDELLDLKIDSVVGASRYEQRLWRAPASVSVVTSDEVKKYGHRTLADILRSVRGLYVSYDRGYSYLGIRSFNRPGDFGTRVLVLVNGHRLNDGVYDSATTGTEFPLDVDLIDRVEVIRGPGSSVYGNNAFFGVINVVTKEGHDLAGGEVSGEAGMWNAYKGRFSYGRAVSEDVEFLVSGTFYDNAGQSDLYYREFDDPATHDGVASHMDVDRAGQTFASVRYRDFRLEGLFSQREKRVPTGPWEVDFNDPRMELVDTRGYTNLRYEREFEGDWEWMARAHYDFYQVTGDYPYGDLSRDTAEAQWWGVESVVTKRLADRHTLVGGAEFRDYPVQDQRSAYVGGVPALDDQRSSSVWAVFAQAEVALRTNLLVNAGARYDHYETFDGTVNPRLGLIWSPWEATTFKAIYGTAFRAPNAYEFYYNDGYEFSKDNPNLDPETIDTYELIWEQQLHRHVRVTLGGYYYEIDDLISQVIDPADGLAVYRNVERVGALGLEVGVEGRTDGGLRARASYAVQRAEDRETGETFSREFPEHLAKLNLLVPVYRERVFGGLELQYASTATALTGGEVDDFLLANFTVVAQELLKGVEVSASVYNLFDVRYAYAGGPQHRQEAIEQDGISFRVKLTYRF
jgi:outer membrane receptor for ferrienterochelin and colicins